MPIVILQNYNLPSTVSLRPDSTWGKDRFTSGSTVTSYKFTGQRQEPSLGLYDYGARWYDPALGRFIGCPLGADTIVPNPGDVQSFDRYAYVNNNPLKYVDPSGHIAVCFQGGDSNDDIDALLQDSAFLQLCQQTLQAGGYREDLHGPIYYRTNGVDAIARSYQDILDRKNAYPDEPVLILGYSWGGAAALDLATILSNQLATPWGTVDSGRPNVEVDLLFLIDPEHDFRGPLGQFVGSLVGQRDGRSRPAPTVVSSNVKSAVNVFAAQANTYIIPQLGVSAAEWTWANGQDEVTGALNVGLAEAYGPPVDH